MAAGAEFVKMSIPQVAIIGRPNVGKSSLFNWLAGKRLAIVDDVAGITRDRMTRVIEEEDHLFEIIDTGGIGINDVDDLSDEIETQIAVALDLADVVLFMVDVRSGLAPLDVEVADRLRGVGCPVICVANKADADSLDSQADEFYRLGFDNMQRVSTIENRHKQKLLDRIVAALPSKTDDSEEGLEDPTMKVAIVGRRNVGKSTFVNQLAKTDRMIVSEVAGTTRDSVDVRFELDGKAFIAIDTPGLRRRASIKSDVDFYGSHRAKRSIRHADIVLLFFDAAEEISKVDKQLCQYIIEEYKPCFLVVNKWDLIRDKADMSQWADYLRDTFPMIWNVPIAFITGETGKNVKKLMNHAQQLFKQSRHRIGTGELNRLVRKAIDRNPPPLFKHRRAKVYYVTQVSIQPPTIVMVVNNPKAFGRTYRRYLLGFLRDQLSYGEIPIRLFFKKRGSTDERDEIGADRAPVKANTRKRSS